MRLSGAPQRLARRYDRHLRNAFGLRKEGRRETGQIKITHAGADVIAEALGVGNVQTPDSGFSRKQGIKKDIGTGANRRNDTKSGNRNTAPACHWFKPWPYSFAAPRPQVPRCRSL